ncbi:MAG TPA: isocitrate lyase/phosphoenolpyruvate mutase family protein [Acetobacteraceae bacterium]|nr:isocitrate lyase/phosphoenolpyruvate mutase family protein [Acetobacteraceae bacterium]
MSMDQAGKVAAFRALHARAGAFIIPNPWDAGSAKLLASQGFEALATTSIGVAFGLGRGDTVVSLDEIIENCRVIVRATGLPVNADLENGGGETPEAAAAAIARAAEVGVAGGSIEDSSGDAAAPIYPFEQAVARVRAAVAAARAVPSGFVLTARAENLIHGRADMEDTIKRLQAFSAAGADVLYAPGLRSLAEVRAVVQAVDKPVNVVTGWLEQGITLADLAAAGAKRISVGGALQRRALTALLEAGRMMAEEGSFAWAAGMVPTPEVRKRLG